MNQVLRTNKTYIGPIILLAALLAGCSSNNKTPALRVYPTEGLPFSQHFPHAYLTVNELGDSQIVMVSEGVKAPRSQGKILYPTAMGSVKQIVTIRILWRPLPGTRADQPTATNATINWYVRSNMPDEQNDKIDYAGAGFVSVYPNKLGAHVVVKNASLAMRTQSGNMTDPFGKPVILGSFDAVRNDGMAKDILAQLNTQVASR
jgi:hypothetical protein